MAQYLIEDTTLAGLADSARAITGETKELSPAEMKEQLVIAEEAINTQADLIAQISTVLDSKTSGGNENIETCAVTIEGRGNFQPIMVLYTTIDENGNIIYKEDTCSSQSITITCLKNSIIAIKFNSSFGGNLDTNSNNVATINYDVLCNDNNLIMATLVIYDTVTIYNDSTSSGGSID